MNNHIFWKISNKPYAVNAIKIGGSKNRTIDKNSHSKCLLGFFVSKITKEEAILYPRNSFFSKLPVKKRNIIRASKILKNGNFAISTNLIKSTFERQIIKRFFFMPHKSFFQDIKPVHCFAFSHNNTPFAFFQRIICKTKRSTNNFLGRAV